MSHKTDKCNNSVEDQLLELIELPCGQDNDVRELIAFISSEDVHGISHIGHNFNYEIEDTTFNSGNTSYRVKDYFSIHASGLYLTKSTQGIYTNKIDISVKVKDFAGRYKDSKEIVSIKRDSNCYCSGGTTTDNFKEDYWENNPCTSTTLPPAITLSAPTKVTAVITDLELLSRKTNIAKELRTLINQVGDLSNSCLLQIDATFDENFYTNTFEDFDNNAWSFNFNNTKLQIFYDYKPTLSSEYTVTNYPIPYLDMYPKKDSATGAIEFNTTRPPELPFHDEFYYVGSDNFKPLHHGAGYYKFKTRVVYSNGASKPPQFKVNSKRKTYAPAINIRTVENYPKPFNTLQGEGEVYEGEYFWNIRTNGQYFDPVSKIIYRREFAASYIPYNNFYEHEDWTYIRRDVEGTQRFRRVGEFWSKPGITGRAGSIRATPLTSPYRTIKSDFGAERYAEEGYVIFGLLVGYAEGINFVTAKNAAYAQKNDFIENNFRRRITANGYDYAYNPNLRTIFNRDFPDLYGPGTVGNSSYNQFDPPYSLVTAEFELLDGTKATKQFNLHNPWFTESMGWSETHTIEGYHRFYILMNMGVRQCTFDKIGVDLSTSRRSPAYNPDNPFPWENVKNYSSVKFNTPALTGPPSVNANTRVIDNVYLSNDHTKAIEILNNIIECAKAGVEITVSDGDYSQKTKLDYRQGSVRNNYTLLYSTLDGQGYYEIEELPVVDNFTRTFNDAEIKYDGPSDLIIAENETTLEQREYYGIIEQEGYRKVISSDFTSAGLISVDTNCSLVADNPSCDYYSVSPDPHYLCGSEHGGTDINSYIFISKGNVVTYDGRDISDTNYEVPTSICQTNVYYGCKHPHTVDGETFTENTTCPPVTIPSCTNGENPVNTYNLAVSSCIVSSFCSEDQECPELFCPERCPDGRTLVYFTDQSTGCFTHCVCDSSGPTDVTTTLLPTETLEETCPPIICPQSCPEGSSLEKTYSDNGCILDCFCITDSTTLPPDTSTCPDFECNIASCDGTIIVFKDVFGCDYLCTCVETPTTTPRPTLAPIIDEEIAPCPQDILDGRICGDSNCNTRSEGYNCPELTEGQVVPSYLLQQNPCQDIMGIQNGEINGVYDENGCQIGCYCVDLDTFTEPAPPPPPIQPPEDTTTTTATPIEPPVITKLPTPQNLSAVLVVNYVQYADNIPNPNLLFDNDANARGEERRRVKYPFDVSPYFLRYASRGLSFTIDNYLGNEYNVYHSEYNVNDICDITDEILSEINADRPLERRDLVRYSAPLYNYQPSSISQMKPIDYPETVFQIVADYYIVLEEDSFTSQSQVPENKWVRFHSDTSIREVGRLGSQFTFTYTDVNMQRFLGRKALNNKIWFRTKHANGSIGDIILVDSDYVYGQLHGSPRCTTTTTTTTTLPPTFTTEPVDQAFVDNADNNSIARLYIQGDETHQRNAYLFNDGHVFSYRVQVLDGRNLTLLKTFNFEQSDFVTQRTNLMYYDFPHKSIPRSSDDRYRVRVFITAGQNSDGSRNGLESDYTEQRIIESIPLPNSSIDPPVEPGVREFRTDGPISIIKYNADTSELYFIPPDNEEELIENGHFKSNDGRKGLSYKIVVNGKSYPAPQLFGAIDVRSSEMRRLPYDPAVDIPEYQKSRIYAYKFPNKSIPQDRTDYYDISISCTAGFNEEENQFGDESFGRIIRQYIQPSDPAIEIINTTTTSTTTLTPNFDPTGQINLTLT